MCTLERDAHLGRDGLMGMLTSHSLWCFKLYHSNNLYHQKQCTWPCNLVRHGHFGDRWCYNIIFSAFLEDLSKKYLFEWLIYVCHKTVIEDLSIILASDPDVRAPDDKFLCFEGKVCLWVVWIFLLPFLCLPFLFFPLNMETIYMCCELGLPWWLSR